jgi:hypothetical protein
LDEALEDASNATVVLRAELEELAKDPSMERSIQGPQHSVNPSMETSMHDINPRHFREGDLQRSKFNYRSTLGY